MGRTGYFPSLMDHCLLLCSCWTGKRQPKHESDHPFEHTFPIPFILLNQKAKGRHFTPTVCLMRMPGVSRDTLEREKNNGFSKLRPNSHLAGESKQVLSSEMLPTFNCKYFTVDLCISIESFHFFLSFFVPQNLKMRIGINGIK